MPKQSSGTTFAQNNAATITSGYNPTGTATGRRGTETKEQRRNRLLRKGGQMRMSLICILVIVMQIQTV